MSITAGNIDYVVVQMVLHYSGLVPCSKMGYHIDGLYIQVIY